MYSGLLEKGQNVVGWSLGGKQMHASTGKGLDESLLNDGNHPAE